MEKLHLFSLSSVFRGIREAFDLLTAPGSKINDDRHEQRHSEVRLACLFVKMIPEVTSQLLEFF